MKQKFVHCLCPKIALYFLERKHERFLRHTIGSLEYCDMDRILISENKKC